MHRLSEAITNIVEVALGVTLFINIIAILVNI